MTAERATSHLDDMVSARWLMEQTFPPLEYVVPGLIPEGLSLLAAPPKIGKSWMVLGLGLACASGGFAFGQLPVQRRPVLYLALEDGFRRLQSRLTALGVREAPDILHLKATIQPRATLATINEFMDLYDDHHPLVVLDTLGRAMPPVVANEPSYQRDYRITSALKSSCDSHRGSSLIVVHHTRKADSADFLDAVSGTQGIAGAADTVMVLKRARQERSAVLSVTSRDAREGTYALSLREPGIWVLDGSDVDDAARTAQTNVATDGVAEEMARLIAAVNRHPEGISPKELAAALKMSAPTVRIYLRRATERGRIANPKRGLYTPATCATSVASDQEYPSVSHTSNTCDTDVGIASVTSIPPGITPLRSQRRSSESPGSGSTGSAKDERWV